MSGGQEDEGKVRRRRKEVGEGQEGVAGGVGPDPGDGD